MITYIYPQNLKATANLWLWGASGLYNFMCVRTAFRAVADPAGIYDTGGSDPVLWIFNHPSGRNHSAGLYPVCGALLYFHPTEL